MKKLFNTTICFFILAFALILTVFTSTTVISSKSIDLSTCIKNINNETAVLVLNNKLNEEISSRNNRSNHVSNNACHLILASEPVNNIYIGNKTHIYKYFIHNFANNNQKAHQIRAP